MSAFSTYLIGIVILVVGLALAAYLLNVPALWILVGVIVVIGIGWLAATSRTKPLDRPHGAPPPQPPPPPAQPPRSTSGPGDPLGPR
jgi:positive regulator of sigma E activity